LRKIQIEKKSTAITDDELTWIANETEQLKGDYKLVPDGPERNADNELKRDRELGSDAGKVAKQIFPLLEKLLGYDVFVVQLGSAESITRWVKATEATGLRQDLTAKITGLHMGEDDFWIQINLETKTTGLN
jgi:hypothetical protein